MSAFDPTKKRRYPRIDVTLNVTGQWWTAGNPLKKPLAGTVVALSEGGASLHSKDQIPANAVVEFTFSLGMFKRYTPRGVVRWWRRNGELRELGVMFDVPVPALGAYVRQQLGLPEKSPPPKKP